MSKKSVDIFGANFAIAPENVEYVLSLYDNTPMTLPEAERLLDCILAIQEHISDMFDSLLELLCKVAVITNIDSALRKVLLTESLKYSVLMLCQKLSLRTDHEINVHDKKQQQQVLTVLQKYRLGRGIVVFLDQPGLERHTDVLLNSIRPTIKAFTDALEEAATEEQKQKIKDEQVIWLQECVNRLVSSELKKKHVIQVLAALFQVHLSLVTYPSSTVISASFAFLGKAKSIDYLDVAQHVKSVDLYELMLLGRQIHYRMFYSPEARLEHLAHIVLNGSKAMTGMPIIVKKEGQSEAQKVQRQSMADHIIECSRLLLRQQFESCQFRSLTLDKIIRRLADLAGGYNQLTKEDRAQIFSNVEKIGFKEDRIGLLVWEKILKQVSDPNFKGYCLQQVKRLVTTHLKDSIYRRILDKILLVELKTYARFQQNYGDLLSQLGNIVYFYTLKTVKKNDPETASQFNQQIVGQCRRIGRELEVLEKNGKLKGQLEVAQFQLLQFLGYFPNNNNIQP